MQRKTSEVDSSNSKNEKFWVLSIGSLSFVLSFSFGAATLFTACIGGGGGGSSTSGSSASSVYYGAPFSAGTPDAIVNSASVALPASLPPSETYYGAGYGWHLENTGGSLKGISAGGSIYTSGAMTNDADINAETAWATNTDCTGVGKIAVLDTGVNRTHSDLSANMWTNPGEIAGNGIDDDGNGYVDDKYGYNFVSSNSSNPEDDRGHGTNVSGLIAAQGNNASGVAGICWTAKIMNVKVLDSAGSGSFSDIVEGLTYASKNGARVVNASFGATLSTSSDVDAINYLSSAFCGITATGVLVVAAAGNSAINNDGSYRAFPASLSCGTDSLISVASSSSTNTMSYFSNYGASTVDLGAPGQEVITTKMGGGYVSVSGTSFAAPLVSGMAALLWSVNTGYSSTQIKARTLMNGKSSSYFNGKTVTGDILSF